MVKGRLGHAEAGYLYVGAGLFRPDRQAAPPLGDAALRALAGHPRRELTYTCAPPGSGRRVGIDRDGDGHLDGDEADAGSDPADPTSLP